ncbi:PLP-dependent aminotransferase family protein [Cellulomonas sp. McL0617]|uniref:MocR-like transcription factor YczR n=1 Tax=Cellulomonas sp. McL0617 TaxID=3415675 RepID=UPI003CEB0274
MNELPTDRRIGGHRLRSVLGAWQRTGPAYVALADALRAAILSGTLPLSTRLPSERELADATGVSRTTTTATYGLLRDEGYLVSRRGSGTVTTLPSGRGARAPFAGSRDDGQDVIDFSMAAPSAPSILHGCYLAALDALPRHLGGTGYTPLGVPVLREAIAGWYTRRGTPTTPDQILVTTGAQQAIHLLVHAHAGPGDRVVVEHPTYPHAIDVVRAAGARPVPVPFGVDGLDIDLLESTIRQVSPRLVYLIPAHHNPTGTSLDDEERAAVRALARRYRTTVVGDEVMAELTMEGPAPSSFAGDGTGSAFVASIGSASKSFWGGLRVGWVRGHPDLVSRLATARASVDIGTPLLEQLVVTELLAQPDAVLDRRRAVLREQRDELAGLVRQQLPSWRFAIPRGGLFLWADLGAPVSSALSAISGRYGVRIVPGTAFGVDGSFERNLRLPFSTSPDGLRLGVARLAEAWAGLGVTEPTTTSDRVHAMV